VADCPKAQATVIEPAVRDQFPTFFAEHRDAQGFFNPWGRTPIKTPRELLRWQTGENVFKAAKGEPPEVSVQAHPVAAFQDLDAQGRLMWMGHASAMIEIDGLRVLVDPVFGSASPVVPRKVPAPVLPADLPRIHVVVVTHGHYDHLDRGSLRALGRRFGSDVLFVVPLALGRSLPRACRRIVELDLWQHVVVQGVSVHMVPAQHWHRRTPFDTNRVLWGGTVISGSRSVYHSGDTGFSGHFQVIGQVFPSLHAAFLPLGAYEPRWFMGSQHMNPAESVQGFLDLGARHFVGMHWGTFDLTDEPLDHGARVLLPALMAEHGLDSNRVHVLPHGGSLGLGATSGPDRPGDRSPPR
jgi:L-ascorbate metabolism protein UlaG (beta-lactamase superfamily)